jgi:hypothetical protein
MQFDISELPIDDESGLLMALKKQWDNGNRVENIVVNSSQAIWFDKLAASYHHVVSTTTKPTMIKEYYSPFGEHTWETKHE